jgi:hypothetical protein
MGNNSISVIPVPLPIRRGLIPRNAGLPLHEDGIVVKFSKRKINI